MTPPFTYAHAGETTALDWAKYKLKECWYLAILLARPWCHSSEPVVLHNSVAAKAHFTRQFVSGRAIEAAPEFWNAPIIEMEDGPALVRYLLLIPAVLMALMPSAGLVGLAAWRLRRRGAPVLIFCDAHLSGFVLALALRARGVPTATLQHGLYRGDDKGSIMGLRNFVSDRIFLWNELTRDAFLAAGHAPERLVISGQYGFSHLTGPERADGPEIVVLGPPYDAALLPLFEEVSQTLRADFDVRFSLHPRLRGAHARLGPFWGDQADGVPRVAVCGDSGFIMDCLARKVPVVSISERMLAATHLDARSARELDLDGWRKLFDNATRALHADRMTFGFHESAPRQGGLREIVR